MYKTLLLFFIFTYLGQSLALAKVIHVVSLEWPPFTCASCEGKGITIPILEDIVKSSGDKIVFQFVPWSRAMRMINDGSAHLLWPTWPSDIAGHNLFLSKPLFHSPLVVVARQERGVVVNKLEDLLKYKVGVVQDYGYYEELRIMIKNNPLKFESVTKDELNIEKLKKKRLDAIIIDKNNFDYFNKDNMLVPISGPLKNLPLAVAGNEVNIKYFDNLLKKYLEKNNIQALIDKKLHELSYFYILKEKEKFLGTVLNIPHSFYEQK